MNDQSNAPSPKDQVRKPYQKPRLEVVQLRVKEDVLAVCKTGSTATGGANCKITPCFS